MIIYYVKYVASPRWRRLAGIELCVQPEQTHSVLKLSHVTESRRLSNNTLSFKQGEGKLLRMDVHTASNGL